MVLIGLLAHTDRAGWCLKSNQQSPVILDSLPVSQLGSHGQFIPTQHFAIHFGSWPASPAHVPRQTRRQATKLDHFLQRSQLVEKFLLSKLEAGLDRAESNGSARGDLALA
jgi:hypothetical protein